jgi:hypothetical protein
LSKPKQNLAIMGAAASVEDSARAKKVTTSPSEDCERKESIMSKEGRLSIDDVQELCVLEEHHDPSKHLFYVQIFNTLKEWDREVGKLFSSLLSAQYIHLIFMLSSYYYSMYLFIDGVRGCVRVQGGVDVKKLVFITGDICEREVLQLFLTFCDGKMDHVQFLEFTKRTKLYCKSRLSSASVHEIFDTYSFKIDSSDSVSYINYCAFRFKIIPVICEKKKEDVSRVINKLCWIDYSHFVPHPEVEGNERVRTIVEDPEESGEQVSGVQESSSIAASKPGGSSEMDVVSAVTHIQRIQRGRQAAQLVSNERALHSTHNSPLSSAIKQKLALLTPQRKGPGGGREEESPGTDGGGGGWRGVLP